MEPAHLSQQIDRILRSQTFANKRQLRRLLEVLFKNMNSQDMLTADLVISELWPEETRTKRSADVATEMNRLRHALHSYYEGEGDADSITFYLPNRSVTAGDGTQQRPWIVARWRANSEDDIAEGRTRKLRTWVQLILVAALTATLVIVGLFSIRMLLPSPQPRSGHLEGTVLRIMDGEGKEIWSKYFLQGFGPDLYYEKDKGNRIWFVDLEGKGHTSVLFSYLPAPDSQPHSSTLICYSDRGKEKWRWTPGRDLPEVGQPATYRTFSVSVLKATGREPSRIAVLSNRDPWWGGPSQIAILDLSGKTLSEYWHSGGLRDMALADLDGDGREEIIATGNAHAYGAQATLVVLDPDRVSGASQEVQPEYQIHGMGLAQERLRLLFPRSDFNRMSFRFNIATEPTVERGNLQLTVLECAAPLGCPIRYEFDKNIHLTAAFPANDDFRAAHDRFYKNGKDAHELRQEERAAFLKVRCLVGCKSEFVPVAETYSPSASFAKGWTARANPNGVWSYGYSAGFAEPLTLYDKTAQNGVNGPYAQFWLSSSVDVGTSPAAPAAELNDGPALNDGNVDLLPKEFLLVAGIQGQYSDLIFTAPAVGEYSIAGSFRGAQYGVGTVVGIVANGKVLFRSSVTSAGQLVPFNLPLSLQARSTVVFSVGPGNGSQNTGLSVTITKPCALADTPTSTPAGEITCSSRQPPNHRSSSPLVSRSFYSAHH